MGYFPNGTSGMDYQDWICRHCLHQKLDDGGCPVMRAHLLHNYDECNNPDSVLHILIPLTEDKLDNERCTMFHPADENRCRDTPDMFEAAE